MNAIFVVVTGLENQLCKYDMPYSKQASTEHATQEILGRRLLEPREELQELYILDQKHPPAPAGNGTAEALTESRHLYIMSCCCSWHCGPS